MLGLIAAVYLLLALRIRVQADAALCGASGSVSLCAFAAGICLRYDGVLRWQGGKPRILPRYGVSRSPKRRAENRITRFLRRQLRHALHTDAQVFLHACVGLGDAAQNALAAGALRSAVSAACAALGVQAVQMRIGACDRPCLLAQARCIFSFQLGDIMLAALKSAARRKTGKEGLGWKSIPLRA